MDRFIIHGGSFRDLLEPELLRLFSQVWDRRADPLRPCWIVTPAPGLGRHLKRLLLENGVPLLGVEFLVPGVLRERLRMEKGLPPPLSRSQLEFLLRRELAARCPSEQQGSAALAQAFESLAGAGHSLDRLSELEISPAAREAVRSWAQKIRGRAVADLDRALLAGAEPALRDAVAYGFDPGDWRDAWLLRAGLESSERAALMFVASPEELGLAADLDWQGWWQEHGIAGESESLPKAPGAFLETPSAWRRRRSSPERGPLDRSPPQRRPLDGSLPERGTPRGRLHDAIHFFRFEASSDEAIASAALAASWAAEMENPRRGRVAIVTESAGPLSRRIVEELRKRGVPFEDQIGSLEAPSAEREVLAIWLRAQETGLALAEFDRLRELSSELADTPAWNDVRGPADWRDLLEEAVTCCGTDDVRVLARWVEGGAHGPKWPGLRNFIAAWDRLRWPEALDLPALRARLAPTLAYLFAARAYELIESLEDFLSPLEAAWGSSAAPAEDWSRSLAAEIVSPRRVFHGQSHAPIVVTSPRAARGQTFAATIFAGLNEGVFPAPDGDLPLNMEPLLPRWNDSIRVASRSGGDESIFPLKSGPILGRFERRQITERRFIELVHGTADRIAFSCSRWDDLGSSQETAPSEHFEWARREANPAFEPIDGERAADALREAASSAWCDSRAPHELRGLRDALRERRDVSSGFGVRQFAFESPRLWRELRRRQALPVKAAENLLRDPAAAWWNLVLNLEPRWAGEDPWSGIVQTRGNRLHGLLWDLLSLKWEPAPGQPLNVGRSSLSHDGRLAALTDWIDQRRTELRRWFGEVPIWWEMELRQWGVVGTRLLEHHREQDGPDGLYAVETSLGTEHRPASFEGVLWSGRPDHIRARGSVWTVSDLKTGRGANSKLSEKRMADDALFFQLAI
ncbi:MAG: hypothetical protein JO317_09385, partial [Verrucomicrobiae bacterium]|nr:hypothetical protein [Verrucomicrobiae bacterium]